MTYYYTVNAADEPTTNISNMNYLKEFQWMLPNVELDRPMIILAFNVLTRQKVKSSCVMDYNFYYTARINKLK